MALKRKTARQAGFTLLELMVVIVILGVLASMVVPNLMGNKEKADTQKQPAILSRSKVRWICISWITTATRQPSRVYRRW